MVLLLDRGSDACAQVYYWELLTLKLSLAQQHRFASEIHHLLLLALSKCRAVENFVERRDREIESAWGQRSLRVQAQCVMYRSIEGDQHAIASEGCAKVIWVSVLVRAAYRHHEDQSTRLENVSSCAGAITK